jgi:hypothetical protein
MQLFIIFRFALSIKEVVRISGITLAMKPLNGLTLVMKVRKMVLSVRVVEWRALE